LRPEETMFRSFFQAGFECSTQQLQNGKRLDLLQSTQHDCLATEDYRRVHEFGIRTIRIAARWHRIETCPQHYDFDSLAVILDAAAETETEVLLDVLHFGWPDHVDLFSRSFPRQFADFTFELTRYLRLRGYPCHIFAPVNEISFLSWAGGEKGCLNPHRTDCAHELKRIFVRAAVASSEVLLTEFPGARLIWPEPVIHIVGDPQIPGDETEARLYTEAQFQAWDMISGRMAPELGGKPQYLDVLGVNYYERNQWVHNSTALSRDDPRYRPFREILDEVSHRYRRPLFVSETGTEDCRRADWFRYVCDEVAAALARGVPVHGICLYPILNHPGWEVDRHCHNGLFDYADANGHREIHWPLAQVLLEHKEKFGLQNKQFTNGTQQGRPDLSFSSSLGVRIPAPSTSNEPVRA
jgi:beta-glucosidase/6-phospho-beta-glucosidase/beta-galactosidase